VDQSEHNNLLFETSPYGNLDAIVEHDGRAVYLYLTSQGRADSKFGTRACWVRNLVPGPYVINTDEMDQGIPPVLPRTHCKYSDSRPVPDAERLQIVWFEEGNGAALLENSDSGEDRTLAVIPPWSGLDGFHGYADECAAENPICWPLPNNPNLFLRIERAREFWMACRSADNHPFAELQEHVLTAYRKTLGIEANYYAIDGGNFPPRGLATFESNELFVAATVGMSFCPQPFVEIHVDNPQEFRRIELAIQLNGPLSEAQKMAIVKQLGGLAAMPWQSWRWLGNQHTCSFEALAAVLGEQVRNVRVELAGSPSAATGARIKLPDFREDPVNLLWLVPISGQVR
jgi:hypothetical protein